jgi:aryl-alcohol dehydrogenase-like predicted oxidoreductase
MSIVLRDFGFTGLKVSAVGFGAGKIGGKDLSDKKVDKLLNSVLDMGINLIDTARSYGEAEHRIGKFLKHRRSEFILSTKVGYDVEGVEDWTFKCITEGVEKALRILQTDYIDIVHLHSCNKDILEKGEVIEALTKMAQEGKIKVPAYSGDNEALEFAVHSGSFASIQSSINICDQKTVNTILHQAKQGYMGVIAKRPLANFAWHEKANLTDPVVEEYKRRIYEMNIDYGMPLEEAMIRFSTYTYGVDSILIGSTSIEHLKANLKLAAKGKLQDELIDKIKNRFNEAGKEWSALT